MVSGHGKSLVWSNKESLDLAHRGRSLDIPRKSEMGVECGSFLTQSHDIDLLSEAISQRFFQRASSSAPALLASNAFFPSCWT